MQHKKQPKPKPKVAIYSLTCCEGCEFAILDQPKKLLELLKKIDLVEWRLLDEPPKKMGKFDIAFVEGSPVTKENEKTLKQLRKNSKYLVVLGNCAHLGGIHRMKNYGDKEKMIKYVYKKTKGIDNPVLKPVSEVVSVDFTLPACPINADEFFQLCYDLLGGKKFKIAQRPVCYECQVNGYDCLLQEGEICLGPLTLGGCSAICLKSRQACWGCRGKIKEGFEDNLSKKLRAEHEERDVERVMEVFGVRDTN